MILNKRLICNCEHENFTKYVLCGKDNGEPMNWNSGLKFQRGCTAV